MSYQLRYVRPNTHGTNHYERSERWKDGSKQQEYDLADMVWLAIFSENK